MNKNIIKKMKEIREFIGNSWNPGMSGYGVWWTVTDEDDDNYNGEEDVVTIDEVPALVRILENNRNAMDTRILCRSTNDCHPTQQYILWDSFNENNVPVTYLSLFQNMRELERVCLYKWEYYGGETEEWNCHECAIEQNEQG